MDGVERQLRIGTSGPPRRTADPDPRDPRGTGRQRTISTVASEAVYRRQRSRIYEIRQIDTNINLEFPQSHTEAYGIVHLVGRCPAGC